MNRIVKDEVQGFDIISFRSMEGKAPGDGENRPGVRNSGTCLSFSARHHVRDARSADWI